MGLLEHLKEFAKINLANLVIWQLAKIYAKLKRRLSPRVCHLDLVKLKIRPTKITGSTTAASHPVIVPPVLRRHQVGEAPHRFRGSKLTGLNTTTPSTALMSSDTFDGGHLAGAGRP